MSETSGSKSEASQGFFVGSWGAYLLEQARTFRALRASVGSRVSPVSVLWFGNLRVFGIPLQFQVSGTLLGIAISARSSRHQSLWAAPSRSFWRTTARPSQPASRRRDFFRTEKKRCQSSDSALLESDIDSRVECSISNLICGSILFQALSSLLR